MSLLSLLRNPDFCHDLVLIESGPQEVSLTAFALLFSEMVQYCQTRSNTVPELQQKLHDLGFQAGFCVSEVHDLRYYTVCPICSET